MPVYEYECRVCGEEFESFRGLSEDDNKVTCPMCGEKGPKRVISRTHGKVSGTEGNLDFPT